MTLAVKYDGKIIPILIVNLILIYISYILNDVASGFGFYLYFPILFILVPSLFLSLSNCIIAVFLTAMIWESGLPIKTFYTPFVWICVGVIINNIRLKYRSLEGFSIMIMAIIMNFILFAMSCFVFPNAMTNISEYISRTLVDMIISSLFVMISINFVVELNRSIFYFFGVGINIKEENDNV